VNRYDAVTFDMGSTLVYFHPSLEELYLDAFHSLELYPDPEALRLARDTAWQACFGGAASAAYEPSEARDRELEERMMWQVLQQLDLGHPDLLQPLLAASKAVFQAPGAVRLYPEVEDVLGRLRASGLALGIISNWSWDLPDYVDLLGLAPYFDVVVGSSRAGCDKPHPDIFRQALRSLGVRPERAIHIGDSHSADVAGAQGAGMDALWLDRAGDGDHNDCRAIRDLTGVLDVVLG
jgi:HAD superfamily hydrolase (TIGR01509 family)